MCNAEDCSYCGGPHHVLLCYKKENDMKNRGEKPEPSTSNPNNEFKKRKRFKGSDFTSNGEDEWDDDNPRKK